MNGWFGRINVQRQVGKLGWIRWTHPINPTGIFPRIYFATRTSASFFSSYLALRFFPAVLMMFATFPLVVSLEFCLSLCWKQQSQWAPYNGLWDHTIWGRLSKPRSSKWHDVVFFQLRPRLMQRWFFQQFSQMIVILSANWVAYKNLSMTWFFHSRFFQVKVTFFKVLQKLCHCSFDSEVTLRLHNFLPPLQKFVPFEDLLDLGKLSFNEQFSVLQVPGRLKSEVFFSDASVKSVGWISCTGWNMLQLFWELCEELQIHNFSSKMVESW